MTHVDTINVINTVSNPLLPDHEIRKLRWTVKQLGKQLGRQGETIHNLRCELAEVRALNYRVERGELRDYERGVERMNRIIQSLEADNARLLAELKTRTDAPVNDTAQAIADGLPWGIKAP